MNRQIPSQRNTPPVRRHLKRRAVAAAVALALGTAPLVAMLPAEASLFSSSPDAAEQQGPQGFSSLVKKVRPAVVTVAIEGHDPSQLSANGKPFDLPQFPPDSPFGDLFRHFFEQRGIPNGPEGGPKIRGLGSGFIVDPSGYIVTNNHVVDHADKVTVILDDGQRYPAKVLGRDEKTDLALVKIDAGRALPYAEFGNSKDVNVGDWVVAVGNPFGLGGTVTAGIVSARGRDIQSGPYDDYLQVDAPINRGNSGGPLIDMSGKVIGINTAIWSPSGGNVGIGFAIPASEAQPIVAQLRASGHVERGWLGVKIQPVTQEVADSLGLKEPQGALVAEVTADSPAAHAGLKVGDVITEVDGKPVKAFRDLPWLVANAKPDTHATLQVTRAGENRTLVAVIGTPPQTTAKVAQQGDQGQPSGELGLAVVRITPQVRQDYSLNDNEHGVLVVGVKSDSPAADAGLEPGTVIRQVDQQVVNRPQQLAEAVHAAAKGKHRAVLLLVEKQGEQRFVTVNLVS